MPAVMRLVLLCATGLLAPGCATNATAFKEAPDWNHRAGTAIRADILWVEPEKRCALPSTQVLPAAEVDRIRQQWRPRAGDTPGQYTAPHLVTYPERMQYPPRLLEQGLAGGVLVLLAIDRDGRIASAHAVCSTREEFIAPALAAARQYVPEPARRDGNAVPEVVFQPFVFMPDDFR